MEPTEEPMMAIGASEAGGAARADGEAAGGERFETERCA